MAAEHSPLEQFEIKSLIPMNIGGLDVSFTNASLFMVIAIVAITLFLTVGMRKRAMVPGRFQSMAELMYEFTAGMLKDNVGSEGRKYFPFIFSLFMFILFCNVIGLIPYTFTVTSQIIVTFAMAAVVFVGVTLIGIFKHGFKFLSFFVPSGVPFILLIVLVPIEVISYFVRPISLSVRLFANMLAGHTLLKVFGGFVVVLGLWLGWMPFLFIVVLTGLELLVALLQAYVFAVLSCLYLNDALHLHH
ncbi:MAG: F0F1 ATP synthase subunit A [Alphaproteobacteria bacterium]|nr:MAG: F0F1 ATP synthase subunit A [Alphaproteobacteria bacterium]